MASNDGGAVVLVEAFGPSRAGQERFATGPIVGFRVEDDWGVREVMEAAGVEFIGPVRAGEGAPGLIFGGRRTRSTRSCSTRAASSPDDGAAKIKP